MSELLVPHRAGLLAAAGDVDAMAQTLDRLAADVALRYELGENGRALAETRFNWQAESRRLVDIYARIDQGAA